MSTGKKSATKAAVKRKTNVRIANKEVVSEIVPQPEPKSMFRKFLFFLQLRDGFWSIPLTWVLYYYSGIFMGWMFGYTTGFYDPSFIQPLFMAGCLVIGAENISRFIVWINYRVLQRYVYGKHKPAEGIIKNLSKEDFNEKLLPWQRICITLFTYLFFTTLVLVVYIKIK